MGVSWGFDGSTWQATTAKTRGVSAMGQFLAVTFDGADDAEAALQSIRSVEHAGKLGLEDTAVVRKDADGKVTFHNEASSGTETGRGHRRGARRPPVRRLPGRGDRRRRIAGGLDRSGCRARDRRRLRQGGRRGPAGRWLGPVPAGQVQRSGTGQGHPRPVPRARCTRPRTTTTSSRRSTQSMR